MFQLLPCSVCQRTLSLRQEATEDSVLKCPNCGNQFRLGDLLDVFYSPWIVLDTSASSLPSDLHALTSRAGSESPINAPDDARLSFDNLLDTHQDSGSDSALRGNAITDDVAELAADNVFDGAELELPESQSVEDGLSVDDGSDFALEETNSEDEPLAIGTHQIESPMDGFESTKPAVKKLRASKSDKGGLWSIIQVVLGGAAAIPVTLLLLWYVAGKDVMNAGPTVAQYVPWIVPQKLRSPGEFLPPPSNGPRAPAPALGEGGFRNFDAELSKPESSASVDAPSPSEVASNDLTVTASLDSPKEPVDGSGMADTFATVRLAKEKIAAWDANSPEQATQAAQLFDDLLRLSGQLSNFPADGGAMRTLKNDLNDIGRAFKDNADLRKAFLGFQSNQFTKSPIGPRVIYLGSAKEVTEADDQWIIVDKIGTSQANFEVSKLAIPNIKAGQIFFCWGEVIEDSTTSSDAGAPKIIRVSAKYLQIF